MKPVSSKNVLHSLIGIAVISAILGFLFYKLAIDTDMRVANWLHAGVNIDKIADESPKEQQYGLLAMIAWALSFIFIVISCIQWLKYKRNKQLLSR
jgi:hypothetical protein